MLKGFKDFLMRGNVVDLAVAVVIGAAFGSSSRDFSMASSLPYRHDRRQAQLRQRRDSAGQLCGDRCRAAQVQRRGRRRDRSRSRAAHRSARVAAAIYFVVVMPLNKLAERRARGLEPETKAPSEESRAAHRDPRLAEGSQLRPRRTRRRRLGERSTTAPRLRNRFGLAGFHHPWRLLICAAAKGTRQRLRLGSARPICPHCDPIGRRGPARRVP